MPATGGRRSPPRLKEGVHGAPENREVLVRNGPNELVREGTNMHKSDQRAGWQNLHVKKPVRGTCRLSGAAEILSRWISAAARRHGTAGAIAVAEGRDETLTPHAEEDAEA